MEIENIITSSNYSAQCVAVLPRFIETSTQVGLSSTTTTQCKVNTFYAISCTNKLTNGIKYKFQVVTITVSDVGYLTQTSQPIVATPTDKPTSFNTIILAVVIVATCTLIVLVGAYFYKKQKNNQAIKDRSPELQFVQSTNAIQQDGTNCEGAYANLEVVHRSELDILTIDLVNKYKNMLFFNEAAFVQQFQELATATKEIILPKTHAENPDNKKKNRYKNILPYDATRVELKKTAESFDYINANYIDGYSQERKFIATQGPLDRTTGDFWRMVWEQECLVIVMLTNVVESGKIKCAKYWPDQGKRCTYDGYSVETVTEVDYGSYIVRTINIEETNNEYATALKQIQHFHYIAWPDHGVPLITSSIIQMQKNVNAKANSENAAPIIVHCSAGAGRTGAYIGFDILLDEMKSRNRVNVYRTVLNMRKQRMDMVQNMKQYIFIHKLITECYALGNTEVDVAELQEHISQQTILLEEFDNLSIILPLTTSQKIALQHSDDPGNKDVNVLPYDHSIVRVLNENDEDSFYLNASFISDYSPNETFIVAQDPVPANVDIFWRAVVDNNVNVIVMLSTVGNGETKDNCIQYWPNEVGQSQTYDTVNVTLLDVNRTHAMFERKLDLECGHLNETITHIQCLFWGGKLDIQDTESLVNLISIAGHLKGDIGKILVHCCDGAGRSGVFCAVNNIIKRLRTENRIDVFRTVKDLRDMRPHMVRSAEQYLTCYNSIIAFQSSVTTYANL
uniref:receptor-type tyrosine-protein phosphatase epsilon-like isoform X2 n=1 Tax=Ciona intestinalis TaxID=7719 RepID=UPI00052144A2|nr:receptor-type tyrosine-protein phosphatase epsilon-like isoform X2 [Ciona intestinalis]|eukprot:XP_026696169.1 receptor-type tyrosine-protein phosphatase epsilon-like isoform X2 [Ciona intestinalis]